MTTAVAEKVDLLSVTIGYGLNTCDVQVPPGTNIAALTAMPHVRAQLGLKDGQTISTIKGTHVDPTYTLRAGDQIEVVRAVDEKA